MMLPREGYVLSENFVTVRRFSQTLQAHKLNMIKREKLARHPRTIWRIWACDVTPTSRMTCHISYQESYSCQARTVTQSRAESIRWDPESGHFMLRGSMVPCYIDITSISQQWGCTTSHEIWTLFRFCCVLLQFGTAWFDPYPSGLLHWHWGNHMIAPVPGK